MTTLVNVKSGVLFGILSAKLVIIISVVVSALKIVLLVSEMTVCTVPSLMLMEEVLVIPGNSVMVLTLIMPETDVKMTILKKVANNGVLSSILSVLKTSTMLHAVSALLTVLPV